MLDSKKYKYVKNILSLDIVNFLSTWSLKNFKINFDSQVPLSSALHSKDSEIYYHVLHYLSRYKLSMAFVYGKYSSSN